MAELAEREGPSSKTHTLGSTRKKPIEDSRSRETTEARGSSGANSGSDGRDHEPEQNRQAAKPDGKHDSDDASNADHQLACIERVVYCALRGIELTVTSKFRQFDGPP